MGNQRGAATTVLVIIIAGIALSQMFSVNAALLVQARQGAQIREAYDSTYILENLAIYIQGGADNFAANGGCLPGQDAIAANVCVVPLSPGCDGVMYKGQPQCLSGNGNSTAVGLNDSGKKFEFVAESGVAKEPWFQRAEDYVLIKAASLAQLEFNFLNSHRLDIEGFPLSSQAVASGYGGGTSYTPPPLRSKDSQYSSGGGDGGIGSSGGGWPTTVQPVNIQNIASFSGNLQLTTLVPQACSTNSNCGVIGICPTWMHNACTSASQRITLNFALTQ